MRHLVLCHRLRHGRHHVGRRPPPGQAEGRPGADQLRLLHPGLRRHLPAVLPPQDEGAGHRVPLGPAPLGHRGLEVAYRRRHPLPLHGDALEPPAVVHGRQGAGRPGPLLGHPAHHRRHLRDAGPDAPHRPRGRHRRPFADQVDHLGRLRHRRGAHQPQAHHDEGRERPSPVQGELRRIRQVPALPGQRAGLRADQRHLRPERPADPALQDGRRQRQLPEGGRMAPEAPEGLPGRLPRPAELSTSTRSPRST